MPPMIYLFFVIAILISAAIYVSSSRKRMKRELQDQQKIQNLSDQLLIISDKFQGLEKRLSNVEMIVTDTKFEESSEREAINLKSEISELREIILNLKK